MEANATYEGKKSEGFFTYLFIKLTYPVLCIMEPVSKSLSDNDLVDFRLMLIIICLFYLYTNIILKIHLVMHNELSLLSRKYKIFSVVFLITMIGTYILKGRRI